VSFRPKNAHICPACTSDISSLLLACINNNLPTLSFCPVTGFNKESHDLTIPEYILTNVRVPTNGSVAILNAIAETGSSSDGFLSILISISSGSTPTMAHLSNGFGR
jgi:hypothetical protein